MGAVAAIAVVSMFGAVHAEAATVRASDNRCLNSDLGPVASDCFGGAPGQNSSQVDVNGDMFQDAGGTTTGLFGIQTWTSLAKIDSGSGPAGDIGLQVFNIGSTSGTWSVIADSLKFLDQVMVFMAGGSNFAAYLYDPGSAAGDGGSFDMRAVLNPSGKNVAALSNFEIFYSGAPDGCGPSPSNNFCGVDNPPPSVTLPAGLPLMLTAIGVGAFMRNRSRKSA